MEHISGAVKAARSGLGSQLTSVPDHSSASSKNGGLDQSIEDQIRDRAYGLYVQRGRKEGNALTDWLDAEFEMLAGR